MKDYGFDPLGNGKWKLVPSGRIVNLEELEKLFPRKTSPHNRPILGMTWDELERKQGGRIKDKPTD